MAKELKKASFLKRLAAYIIDYLIVVILVSLLSGPFVDVQKTDKYQKETNTIMEKYQNNEITATEYMQSISPAYYNLSRSTGVMTFITILIDILYFVVLQFVNKGQTFGKKLLKIKVVSTDGDLSMNQMIFRSLIANMILLHIINFALITFASKNIYIGVFIPFAMIQYLIMFVSIIMSTTKDSRTIHDRIAHTRVVNI